MMNIFRQLLSQQGFSLVQGMILSGILAGTSLVATKLIQDQKLAQKSAESKDQLNELHKMVFNTLQKNVNCEQTMDAGINPGVIASIETKNPSVNNQGTTHPALTRIVTADGNPIIQTNRAYMNEGVEVRGIELIYPLPGALTPGFGKIRITYQRLNQNSARRTKQGYGAKDIAKEILIRVVRSTTNPYPFESCYAVSDNLADENKDLNKQMCEDLEIFTWSEASSKCELREDLQCDAAAGMVYTGIDSDGSARCRPLMDWIDFSQVFEPSVGNCEAGKQISLQVLGNRVRVRCI